MSGTTDHPGTGSRASLDRLTLIAFVVLVFLGGNNAVAVRFSNFELPPFWGAATRFFGAALIFWIIMLWRRIPLPSGRALIGCLLYGALSIGAAYAFLYWSLLTIQASLAMIVLALGPLLTLLFATAHRLEQFRWRGLAGALIALAGITLAVAQELGSSIPVLSLLALLAGAACIAEASVVYKLFPRSDPLATNALSTTTGAVILILISLLAGEAWSLPDAPATWAAFIYLVVIGSVVLFYLYLFVLSRWTASATSYSFLLFPVATIVISAWLTDEAITLRFVAGGCIVLIGVWIGALRQPREAPVEREQQEEAAMELAAPPRPGCA
ncbi:MAG TPA: DMT family transporter [Anaerolineales bacterium]|nr:DMT family transporter [Anaerolineales bacterium]